MKEMLIGILFPFGVWMIGVALGFNYMMLVKGFRYGMKTSSNKPENKAQ